MHQVALSAGPVAVILIGILFGIFYNQRAIEKLESRGDGNCTLARHTLEIIQKDLKIPTAYLDSTKGPSQR